MVTGSLPLLLLAGTLLGQGPDDYLLSVSGGARELSRALELLQRSLATLPRPDTEDRSLYSQLEPVQLDLIYFRQQIQRKASRAALYQAFTKVDEKLTKLMGEMQNFGKWDPAVAVALRRAHNAQHDLYFALSAGDDTGDRQSEAAYRQMLALQARVEDLQNLVRYFFNAQASLPVWNADFADLRTALKELQKLQKDHAMRDALRPQLARVEQVWDKLVARYRALPESQHLLLRSDFGQLDRVLGRLARMVGITDRRDPLKDDYY